MWYLILSRQVEGKEEGRRAHFGEHMDWLLDMHRGGKVLFSGPTSDREVGIYVLVSESLGKAAELAAADPHHVYGERTAEIYEWEVMQAMRLSGGDIEAIEAMAEES